MSADRPSLLPIDVPNPQAPQASRQGRRPEAADLARPECAATVRPSSGRNPRRRSSAVRAENAEAAEAIHEVREAIAQAPGEEMDAAARGREDGAAAASDATGT
ncbi:MAG: hypothetical protein ACXWBQ_18555, partial [Usitatibacter sp.]